MWVRYDLTISKPRSAEYDKWAHIAQSRKDVFAEFDSRPWSPEADAAERVRGALRGMTKTAYQRRRAELLALLEKHGEMTRGDIYERMADVFPLEAQVGRLLTAMKQEGAVVQTDPGGACRQAKWRRA
jgi:hypothetical protein